MTTVLTLVLIPALIGGVAFVVRNDRLRRALLVATAVTHAGLTVGEAGRVPL